MVVAGAVVVVVVGPIVVVVVGPMVVVSSPSLSFVVVGKGKGVEISTTRDGRGVNVVPLL